jgi:hypothetical protein
MDRERFLDSLLGKSLIKEKRLFPDFPEGPRSLKDFRMVRIGKGGYQLYSCYATLHRAITVTLHSFTKEGFIVRLDSLYFPYIAYLKSILGKDITRKNHRYYLEGKEYPLIQGQEYRYDERTRNYYLYGPEPIVKKGIWDYSAKRKINRFLKDLQKAQEFYRQVIPKDTVLRGMTYDDLPKFYDSYLKHGKKIFADPNIITLNIDRWKLEIYRDLGALTIIQRRVNP